MRILALLPALVIAVIMALLTGMWQFALFALASLLTGVLTTALLRRNKKEHDFDYSDQPIWISPGAVAIGDLVLPKTGFFFKEKFSDIFFDYYSQLALQRDVAQRAITLEQSFYKPSKTGVLPFWAGVAENTDLEFDLARDGPHAIIVGSTGSGKSELLKLITGSMLVSREMQSIRLVLIDFKGGAALGSLTRHPSALTMITDIDSKNHERFWLYLQGELKQRELYLASKSLASVEQTDSLPRLIVLADELPAILSSTPYALATLEAIAARGRSLGVHLIVTSQSLAGIPRSLLTNLNLRFALGVTDPGDLVSLMPSIRTAALGNHRAVAIFGSKAVGFDFPMANALPNLGESKVSELECEAWSVGLPLNIPGLGGLVGIIDEPLTHSYQEVLFTDFKGSSVLVVGARGSGKTSFCERIREIESRVQVLDCPSLQQLEQSLESGEQLVVAIESAFVLPLSIQRKFEQIIYLRQSNLDQHLAAALPKSQWDDELPPGRGWFKGKVIQLTRPAQIREENIPTNGQRQQVH